MLDEPDAVDLAFVAGFLAARSRFRPPDRKLSSDEPQVRLVVSHPDEEWIRHLAKMVRLILGERSPRLSNEGGTYILEYYGERAMRLLWRLRPYLEDSPLSKKLAELLGPDPETWLGEHPKMPWRDV